MLKSTPLKCIIISKEFFMADIEILEESIEDLKKQVCFLMRQSNGGSGGGNSSGSSGGSSGGSSSSGWTLLYSKESEDPALNLGFTSGIMGDTGQIADFPDIAPYNFLKITFSANLQKSHFIFDVSEKQTNNNYHLLTHSNNFFDFYGMTFSVLRFESKHVISFGFCTKITFAINKYPVLTNCKASPYYFITKIEAK